MNDLAGRGGVVEGLTNPAGSLFGFWGLFLGR